ACSLVWVLGGSFTASFTAAVGAAVAARRWSSSSMWASGERDRAQAEAALPLVADLLAACLAAGATPLAACAAVAEAVGKPIGPWLERAQRRCSLGEDPSDAWRELCADPVLAPLGRVLARASRTGAPAAELLARAAQDARRRQALAMQDRARRVGVLATLPVGLCFLPSFVVVGIVPTVIGLATSVLR
ncbi:MAG: type II secretion system F family protein, partial [Actinomycetota bacterium]|nr:type II secretion system F family protein [Actinomycetota bacterium]